MNAVSIQTIAAPVPPANGSVGSSGSSTPAAKAPTDETNPSFGDLFSSMFGSTSAPITADADVGSAADSADDSLAAATAKDPRDPTGLDPIAWLHLTTNSHGQQDRLPAGHSSLGSWVVPTGPGRAACRIDAQAGNGVRQALTSEGEAGSLSDAEIASAAQRLSDPATAIKPGAAQPDNVLREALKTAVLQAQAAADTTEVKESLAAHKAVAPASANVSAQASTGFFDPAAAEIGNSLLKRASSRESHPRSLSSLSVSGFVPWSDGMAAGTSHGASPVYAPGALTPAPEAAMAQRVHYWVTRGVQSAELQLDAFAGGSVDVSIAVKGDQAVVEFRTDQPEARRMLLETMPQLKDLLAGEGLMLSGGFVGGSAHQGSGSPAREHTKSGTREGAVQVDDSPRAPQGAAGRKAGAIDLFV